MSAFLSCWILGVFVILIWCSLQYSEEERRPWTRQDRPKDQLEYIPISPALLGEWALGDEHLMIIDLRPNTHAEADFGNIPGSLRIPPMHLKGYFCYLPPSTRLVLYDPCAITRLDSRAENALLMIGIQVVYVLEGAVVPSPGNVLSTVEGKGPLWFLPERHCRATSSMAP